MVIKAGFLVLYRSIFDHVRDFPHHAEVITITGRGYRPENRQAAADQAFKNGGK